MKFLVATDLSAGADRALRRAAMLLSQFPAAQMLLLHVSEPGLLQRLGAGRKSDDRGTDPEDLALDCLGPLVHRVSALCRAAVTPIVVEGDARSCIREQVELHRPDLEVVGFSGQTSLRNLVLGSTAEQLATRASRPLLIVKRAPRAAYQRVLIPVVAAGSAVDELSIARKLAPAAGIVLFHAYSVDVESQLRYASVAEEVIRDARQQTHLEALTQLREKRTQAGPDHAGVELEAVRNHPALAILNAERQHGCDLIVMARHEASPVERFLLGSMTRRILLRSHADVLVLPPSGVPG